MVIMLEDQKLEVPTRVTVNIRPFLRSEVPNDYAGPYFLAAECENLVVSAPDPVFFFGIWLNKPQTTFIPNWKQRTRQGMVSHEVYFSGGIWSNE